MYLLSFLTMLLLYLSESQTKPNNKNNSVTPVILIPGICGSQIDGWYKKDTAPHYYCTKDSKGWTNLWICFECMLPPTISCWVDTIALNISDVNDIKNKDGVQTKVNDFGYTGGIAYLDTNRYVSQFENMIVGLESFPGYQRGISIRGAPYDYRHGPHSKIGQRYMIDLKYLVEDTYEINGNVKVMLLAHSMGNPFTVNFLKLMDQAWKDKYLEGYISISGVFGGAAKSIRAILSGETEGLPQIIVDPLSMRQMERTTPTVYWLMPNTSLLKDTPLVFANGRNYTANDYHTLLEDAKVPKGGELYDTVKNVPLFDEDIGVDVYCIHSKDQKTPVFFSYPDGGFPDTQPTTTNGDGDGTVNIQSLELCQKFKRLKDYKVITGPGPHNTHMDLLLNEDVIKYVADLLTHKNVVFRNETLGNETFVF